MTKKKDSKDRCSLFEEMLMWTSYRYCIGRTSYVSSMARDIARHYYGRLGPEREKFAAQDIRREIGDHLGFMPFGLRIVRTYGEDPYNPVAAVMGFIKLAGIKSAEELNRYSEVEYDARSGEYRHEMRAAEPIMDSRFDDYSLECLIGWENLASCFDRKNHKAVTLKGEDGEAEYECFRSWVRSAVPVPDKPGYFMQTAFGWDEVWVPVEDYLKSGYMPYITADSERIISVEDLEPPRE